MVHGKWRDKMIKKLPWEIKERGFSYPESFIKIIELNLLNYEFWYIMSEEQAERRIRGLRERYPERFLVPFARRNDNDDIACFDVETNNEVHIIHDFASIGFEQREVYKDFWVWFEVAISELIKENKF